MAIEGVEYAALTAHLDGRGSVTEMFRASWVAREFVQWNIVRSEARVLRGVHCHCRHHDYLVLVEGAAMVGLKDLRRDSPTSGQTELLDLRADALRRLTIPPGVAHGFYFPEPSIHVYGVSHYWDPDDEIGCRWDDQDLGIPWAITAPILSPRDDRLPAYAVVEAQVHAKLAKNAVV